MTRNDFREGTLQGSRVERAAELHGRMHVVRRIAGLELIEEPEPLLPEGER